ncbi:DUF2264 domain-containing protein [Mucilaginibacter sp. X5P1]|uniref:DUF2264 domain-containing protein n=1 Tax=Mucilaginibacter sp. X5P1 TaxID=2723088 RepID=UPI0018542DC3|nr:DUF2264 domain-containing protein [Mucilaginibacter sp. X5P1]MBB6140583.1 hypothetical protein [Mucilaginibacter sp. X5P1]
MFLTCISASMVKAQSQSAGQTERTYYVSTLTRIADPVLEALSKNELRKQMPVESNAKGRESSTYLEAFGRLMAGMAPWLELGPDKTPEGKLREKYIKLALLSLHNATDPKAADFMNFNKGSQPVVDAAFLAQALLRAPNQLWGRLDSETQSNVLAALKSSRVITPGFNNWLLFSATIEAALLRFDGSGDRMRMDYAIKQHLVSWYKGDGAYGDGENFHWDYYNSFVIQPMLVGVLKTLSDANPGQKKTYEIALAHAKRYAIVQERMISPEATYPPIGRSLAYRFGAFQTLSMISLMHELPASVKPQQVRAALYTMIKRQVEAPGTFDNNGWLQIGIYGHQPSIGESYISTGSLYLCSEAFLVLGLPPTDDFWQGADEEWTAKKVWEGKEVSIDHAED